LRILVTGGTGYIGSHAAVALIEAGHEVEVVDSLVKSKREVVDRLATITGQQVPLHVLDLRDEDALRAVFQAGHFDAVMHFAALKAVGESIAKPHLYYANNVGGTLSLLAAMEDADVRTLVYSSSACVYGADAPVPYRENEQMLAPTNPYGHTKLMDERVIQDMAAADSRWRIAVLRYFNPVGAHESGLIGEDPLGEPENLMPIVVQAAAGKREQLQVFGDDYPTDDGTCERDYIHVMDLAHGHVAALDAITAGDPGLRTWNLGTGKPTSVRQMIATFEHVTGQHVPHSIAARRPGDLACYYADVSKSQADLPWTATRDVADMCRDAWRWQESRVDVAHS
jgi:UDP-glucose 4-epimerase